jgi:hypothetical protein
MNFNNLVMGVLWEQNISGGAESAFGSGVTKTASSQSGDSYAPNDTRVIKPLYSGVLSRFGMKSAKSNKKAKKRKQKR